MNREWEIHIWNNALNGAEGRIWMREAEFEHINF